MQMNDGNEIPFEADAEGTIDAQVAKLVDKGGRPRLRRCTDKDLHAIELLASIGYSLAWIADDINMPGNLLKRWFKDDPKVKEAYHKGLAYKRRRVMRCIYERAFPIHKCTNKCPSDCPNNGKPESKGDSTMAIFLLKTQYGFVEKQDTTLNNEDIMSIVSKANAKQMQEIVDAIENQLTSVGPLDTLDKLPLLHEKH
jgi:hypothetical protein